MRVKVKFFAVWREIVGNTELDWPFQEGLKAGELLKELVSEFPGLVGASRSSLILVNRQYSNLETVLQPGDEVAFIPPVGGGAGK